MGDVLPASPPARERWALPITLAVAAHLSWMIGAKVPQFPVKPVIRDTAPARVAYAPSNARDIDARFIWSPVIFSLAQGKRNGSTGSGSDNSLPPVVIPDDPPPFAPRMKPAAPAAILPPDGGQKSPVWEAPVPSRMRLPPPAFDVDRSGAGPALNPAWAKSFSPECGGRQAWEASIQIEFGADGLPVSVIVDGPDIPEAARDHLSRTAFGWRRLPSDGPERLGIRVRYSPSGSLLPKKTAEKPETAGATP